jgi:DegV family protein with EDD domain
MSGVEVVTDTTHYLPRELVESNRLHQVSLYVNWDGRADRESDLPDYGPYYEYLAGGDDMPTTSQPSVGDFLEAYEPILERGSDIVSVHLSGGISGTLRAAEQAREQLVERGIDGARVAILDSETAAGGLGIVILAVAGAVARGASPQEAAEAGRTARAAMKMWFAVDTLEYLRRGGRIGTAQAWIGSTLKIKPILTFGREVEPVERVRTTGRAQERLVEYLRERFEDGCDAFAIQHVRNPERAEQLAEAGRGIFGTDPLFFSEIGPVIGTHGGPGLLGVAGVPRSVL